MGFFVLLGFVAYAVVAMIIVKAIGKHTGSNVAKYAAIAVFVLIPTWDILPGHLYHEYLCKAEGGVRVIKTVEVDRVYFLADGRPDEENLRNLFDWRTTTDRAFSEVFHITENQGSIVDRQTGDLLGTATDFWYYGGWINATIFGHLSSSTCPQYPHHSVSGSLWQQVVRPKPDSQRGGQ